MTGGRTRTCTLSAPGTKARRLQDAALAAIREHEATGALPTNARFIFYELLQHSIVSKEKNGGRHDGQNLDDAILILRLAEIVPWEWITDETRTFTEWWQGEGVLDFALAAVDQARIDPWAKTRQPVIITESKALAGALLQTWNPELRRNVPGLAAQYQVPVAPTGGQAHGFLVTEVAPYFKKTPSRALYMGDLDNAGGDIEANTRRVIEKHSGCTFDETTWERLAITPEQVREHNLPPREKRDRRHGTERDQDGRRVGKLGLAYETEALGQGFLVDLVRARLDELLPEPLDLVRVREDRQRTQVRRLLARGKR